MLLWHNSTAIINLSSTFSYNTEAIKRVVSKICAKKHDLLNLQNLRSLDTHVYLRIWKKGAPTKTSQDSERGAGTRKC